MKRLKLCGFLLAVFVGAEHQSFAKPKYGMAGCGLGSLVFDHNDMQVSAVTTNASFGSQMFGITSGTSNCLDGSQAVALQTQEQFIADNFSDLSKDIARGDGATLRALAGTYGCEEAAYPVFSKILNENFEQIFAQPGAMAAYDRMTSLLKSSDNVQANCKFII